ncbi:uncharacterized protein B0T15DRAFT_510329 [Chaetomium strumarium]|uniref:Uncharacterized protein n=1 Tax=Chaetomium strumarium TaxID=1170767 RepID=A0AAJ0M2W2_9PEZI|nr:hypothetical protein B0T15DRAFT_510329 [Chaetomium strumarium]
MAKDSPRDMQRLSSPDPATSEGNSSVQVHLDSASNRQSRSSSVRRSPSRAVEPSLARQATANSISSLFSSPPSSQLSQSDRVPAEDVLRDLIAATEASGDALRGVVHGVKRPRDSEAADEPLPKRDKLTEELDRMSTSQSPRAPIAVSSESSASSSARTSHANSANGAPTASPGDALVTQWTPGTLAFRASRRRPPGMGNNGTATSLGGPRERAEPGHSTDGESNHPSDGSDCQGT